MRCRQPRRRRLVGDDDGADVVPLRHRRRAGARARDAARVRAGRAGRRLDPRAHLQSQSRRRSRLRGRLPAPRPRADADHDDRRADRSTPTGRSRPVLPPFRSRTRPWARNSRPWPPRCWAGVVRRRRWMRFGGRTRRRTWARSPRCWLRRRGCRRPDCRCPTSRPQISARSRARRRGRCRWPKPTCRRRR